jgi:lipoprotein
MNKKLLTVLTAAALAAALAACGEDKPNHSDAPATDLPASLTTQTEATSQTAEATETTPPETTAPAPLPEVKDGTVYTKKAVDMYSGGDFGFTHSLTVPKIDSTKPGAEALNAKILADQQEKLDALAAGKEKNDLYTVTYSVSGADGILAVNVYEFTGWQYSESYSSRRFYYYDAAEDRELTLDETLSKLAMTKESLNRAFAWSSEYAAISVENSDLTRTLAESVFGAPLTGVYDTSVFRYAEMQNGNKAELLGIDFDETTVSPCYRYSIYTVGTVSCPIDRASGQPMHPYYECTPNIADLKVGDSFRITIKDGKVTEMTAPADAKVQRVTIASDGVTVLYGKDATYRMGNADFRVNGESVNWGSNSGGIDAEDVFSNYRFMKEYIPLDKLTTIEFVFKTNLD